MALVTHPEQGLFPDPQEIRLSCDCPDYADLCKHLASVLYGVGIRLDDQPELLFLLRGVDHEELTETDLIDSIQQPLTNERPRIATDDLSNVFGIEIGPIDPLKTSTSVPPPSSKTNRKRDTR